MCLVFRQQLLLLRKPLCLKKCLWCEMFRQAASSLFAPAVFLKIGAQISSVRSEFLQGFAVVALK